jgi:hypothetical protein
LRIHFCASMDLQQCFTMVSGSENPMVHAIVS